MITSVCRIYWPCGGYPFSAGSFLFQLAQRKQTGVSWSSSNTNIATVNSSGLVTGISQGDVTITATSTVNNTITDSISFNVTFLKSSIACLPHNLHP